MKKIGLILLVLTVNLCALPDWSPWKTYSVSNSTIKFRTLTDIINNMQAPFEKSVYIPYSDIPLYTNKYRVEIYEDDAIDYLVWSSGDISLSSGQGINYTNSERSVTGELTGNTEEYYMKVTLVRPFPYSNVVLQTTNLLINIWPDDNLEPNNSFSAAFSLGSSGYTASTLIINENDDYYKFTVPTSANNWDYKIEVNTVYFSAGGNLDIYLFNNSQTQIASSATTNNKEIINKTLSSGTYYIKVARNGSPVRNFYDFSMTQSAQNYLDVSTTSLDVPATTGSKTFDISSNISWTITDNTDWVTITPTSGSGNRQITVNYQANPNITTRKCTVTVTGGSITRTIIVNQAAGEATLTVTPPSRDVPNTAGTTTFNVYSNVPWTANDNVGWGIVTPGQGNGNAVITVEFQQNTTISPRSMTVTVAGGGISKTVTVNQAAEPVVLEVTPSESNVGYQGSTAALNITSNTSWTISDNTSWVNVIPSSGSGNQTVTATYSTNTSTSARTCSVTVKAGTVTRVVAINQEGAPESLSITPSNRDVPFTAGSTTFEIASNISWNVSDNAEWVTVDVTAGSGNRTLNVNFTSNPTTSSRVCSITVSGGSLSQTVTVTQAAAPPTITINPTTLNLPYTGGATTFSLSTNVNWSISDNVSWLTVTPTTGGPGSHTINVSYEANSSTLPRPVTLTISYGGLTTTLTGTQAGAPATLSVTPMFREVPASGGITTFDVTSNVAWSVTDNATWVTITPLNGTSNAQLTADCQANTTTTARVCSVTVTGGGISRVVAINQPGANAVLTVTPSSREVPYTAGSTTFDITANISWTAVSSATWATITTSSGSGNMTLNVNCQANAMNDARSCTITVAGSGITRTVIVNQAGAPAALTVTPSNRDVPANSGNTTFDIASNTSWTVSDNAEWVTITNPSGTGNQTITAHYDTNPGTIARTCSVSVTGGGITKSVTVTQVGVAPYLTVTPENMTFPSVGGSATINIASNINWTLSDDAPWLTLNFQSGNGNQAVITSVSPNTTTVSRVCTVSVSGGSIARTVIVTQLGVAVDLFVTPNNRSVPATAGSTTFDIVSNADWTITESTDWVTLSQVAGSGNATFTANYLANNSIEARTCSITVNSGSLNKIVTVSQAGEAVRFVSSPDTNYVSHSAGQAIYNISSNTVWSVSTTSDWINSITPQNHSGDGQLVVAYSENNNPNSNRICSLRVDCGSEINYLLLIQDAATSVRELRNGIPDNFNLSQNYPNPFNPNTIVRFAIPKESSVKIEVFSSQGELVNVIESSERKPGYYEVDLNMSSLASGIYLYKITAIPLDNSDPYIQTKKFVLLK